MPNLLQAGLTYHPAIVEEIRDQLRPILELSLWNSAGSGEKVHHAAPGKGTREQFFFAQLRKEPRLKFADCDAYEMVTIR